MLPLSGKNQAASNSLETGAGSNRHFSGKLALVTGAGSGIGKQIAFALSRSGASLICVDLNSESAEETATATGGVSYQADVSNRDDMAELAAKVEEQHGVLDILVNNAGVGLSGHFLDTSLKDWDWIVSINLMGVVNGCHFLAPAMVKRGSGHVVNISSGLAFTPRSTEPAYVATKAGVLALSRCLRADWRKAGVKVSAVCPGVTNTPIATSTRYVGERGQAEVVNEAQRLFAKFGHSAESVAEGVLKAIRKNKSVVNTGIETKFGWFGNRVLPLPALDFIARVKLGKV